MTNESIWSASLTISLQSASVTVDPADIPDNTSAVAMTLTGSVIWDAVALSLIVAATAFGNILLCVAVVTEQCLRNMTNYFLASLAVADLLVAVVVMPPAVVVQIHGMS